MTLEQRFPLGSLVRQDGGGIYEVVGYWRGYVTLRHWTSDTTHKAAPSTLAPVKEEA